MAVRRRFKTIVMPGLDPGTNSASRLMLASVTEWIAGSGPAMTTSGVRTVRVTKERAP